MQLDFQLKDVVHSITVKFVRAFLPGAKKKYYAKAVLQPELNVHEIASKASLYNITTPPKVIEDGFNAATKLIYYLIADGFKINTPLIKSRIRIPGEFDGKETRLPEGIYPEVKMTVAIELLRYIQKYVQVIFDGVEENDGFIGQEKYVQVIFDGVEENDGFIGQVVDESTNQVDQAITLENIITLNGHGLKIACKEGNENKVGFFFRKSDGTETQAKAIAVNEPCTLRVVVPSNLTAGESYTLIVRTQTSVKRGATMLKEIREVEYESQLIAQN